MKYREILKRNGNYFAAIACIFLACAPMAAAAEESGNSANARANEIFRWINFAIVVVAIVWIFAKKLPSIFRGNAEKISSAISKATAAKTEADRQLREAQSRLATMGQEIDALRVTAEKDAVAEGDRIRNLTKSDAQKIAAAAKEEVAAADRAARLELKAIAAKLAVDGAESLLVKQLTPAAQASVIADFAKSLEGKAN
jgi:F-type H+-transporting ATPase subunit b